MIIAIILGGIAAWALASRVIFRHWVRNDTIINDPPARCDHGHQNLHKGLPCHPDKDEPASHGAVACYAIITALFLPVTLFIVFVMARPPLGRRELAEKTGALEAENTRLRREQEKP